MDAMLPSNKATQGLEEMKPLQAEPEVIRDLETMTNCPALLVEANLL